MKIIAVLVIFACASLTRFFPNHDTAGSNIPPPADSLRTPEDELKGFKLLDGFEIELVASEREGIVNPIDLTFDDAGRLWTQTGSMYPLDPVADIAWDDLLALNKDPEKQKAIPAFKRMMDLYKGITKGADKILILSNLYNGQDNAEVKVWADGLAIPMSILPYKDGAYIAQGSEMFFLDDTDHDGKADKRIPLFTGFGFTDTHTMAHSLVRGPGEWIYFSHGALNNGSVSSFFSDVKVNIDYSKIARFSLDAKKMELVSSGLNNIWGFQLRSNGQWYGTEANDFGYSVVPMEPGSGFQGIGNERIRSYQPWMPELHKFRVGGTGISGMAFADDIKGSFPEEWKDVAFLANPITSTVNAVKIVRNPDGSVTSSHLADLLSSEDKSFRPVNIEFGPDGCLYIADWYDKIISHNEVPTSDPNRDKSHGRIWRIKHNTQQPFSIPDFYKIKTAELVNYLTSPSLWMKRSAWHQITDRPLTETAGLAPALIALAGDESQEETARILALWSLEGLKHYDATMVNKLLTGNEDNLRREAVRSLAAFSLSPAQVGTLLRKLVEDPNALVRSEVLRTLADIGKADSSTIGILINASKPFIAGNKMGGGYERSFERYLALKALELYPEQLYAYLHSQNASGIAAENLLWAIQALPGKQKETEFLRIWPSTHIDQLDEPTFIWMSRLLTNSDVYNLVKPVYENPAHAAKYLGLALENEQQVQSPELSSLLEAPVAFLLKSSSETEQQLALDAAGRLKVKTTVNAVVALVSYKKTDRTVELALHALEGYPAQSKMVFARAAQNEKLPFYLRAASINSLAKIDSIIAKQTLNKVLAAFDDDQKITLVDVLSASDEGSGLLIDQYNRKRIGNRAFNLSSAERIYNAHPKNKTAGLIMAHTQMQAESDKRAFEGKLNKYVAIAEKKGGDAKSGEVIFQTCLMCHRVGDKGQQIAPALDGSAARENEALLTAVLNPDAAVEGGYALYRVIKNDNSIVEGYLFHKDDRGVTISFMGGSKIFIGEMLIKSQGFLTGRSFMPRGLIENFGDDQVADLLAYIRTLK